MAKKCNYECSHYQALVNQGLWWCELNLPLEDMEKCEKFNKSNNEQTTFCSTADIEI